MNITDCLDQEMINLGKHQQSSLSAYNLEQIEFLMACAKLLYKTKSVRKAITMIDSLTDIECLISEFEESRFHWEKAMKDRRLDMLNRL